MDMFKPGTMLVIVPLPVLVLLTLAVDAGTRYVHTLSPFGPDAWLVVDLHEGIGVECHKNPCSLTEMLPGMRHTELYVSEDSAKMAADALNLANTVEPLTVADVTGN